MPPRIISRRLEARGPDDEVFGDVASFGGKNIFIEPFIEREIVGDAAKEAHSGVSVGIDQAGHDDAAVGVDYFGGVVARFDFGGFSDGDDRIGADCDGTVFDYPALGAHGDDCAVRDEEVGFLFGLGRSWLDYEKGQRGTEDDCGTQIPDNAQDIVQDIVQGYRDA